MTAVTVLGGAIDTTPATTPSGFPSGASVVGTTMTGTTPTGGGAEVAATGVSTGLLIVLLLLIGLGMLAIGYLFGRRRARGSANSMGRRAGAAVEPRTPAARAVDDESGTHPQQPLPTAQPQLPTLVDPDRTALVDALIDARDRLPANAQANRIGKALAAAGVETVDPVGRVFDPTLHWAQGPDRVTDDPDLNNTIAETVTLGYVDRGLVHRLPGVIVHRSRFEER